MTATRTITRRSKNLGIGISSTMAYNAGDGLPRIEPPAGPDVTGNWRTIVDEYTRARRIYGTAAWLPRLYVDGAEVIDIDVAEFVGLIQIPGQAIDVTVAEAANAGH